MKEHLNIQDLKKTMTEFIEQTDDIQVILRCLSAAGISVEEDGAADKMTVSNQLRSVITDKEDLIRQSIHILAGSRASKKHKDKAAPADRPARIVPKKWKTAAAVLGGLAAVVLAGWLLFTLLPMINKGKGNTVVTVAEEYETISVGDCRFNMVLVKGGTFTMGATEDQGDDTDSDEVPTHLVTLSDYYIGETEVTQQLWTAVMGEGPIPYDGDQHPMKNLSYDDCILFIQKLNGMTGRRFHLPTEAQWEFAARGGNLSEHYMFAGSNDIDQVGWYADNSWNQGKKSPNFGNHPVGSKKPNELGIYDMSGNVWEWCHDYYSKYTPEHQKDPSGLDNSSASFRVNRGGSWDYIATSSRVSNRRNRTPDFRNFNLGMRLALDAQ